MSHRRLRWLVGLMAGCLFSYLLALTSNAATRSDKEKRGLLGPVRSLTEYVAECWEQSGKWVEGPRENSEAVDYDRSGRMTKRVFYSEGSVSIKYTWKYDERGRLVEEADTGFSPGFDSVKTYRYSSDGRIVNAIYTCGWHDGVQRGTHEYDSKGCLVEIAWRYYDCPDDYPDGTLASKEVFRYDQKGSKTEELSYHGDGPLQSRTAFHP